MNVYLNEINGLWNAIDSMFMSKRSWTWEREEHIKALYAEYYNRWGMKIKEPDGEMLDLMNKLFKWAPQHITMGRFIDFSFTVEGIHRGAQDDFDSHAARFDNRIIRSSTRLASYGAEKSDWYQDKIITTDEVVDKLGVTLPDRIVSPEGVSFVRAVNGYVREDLQNSKDATRGLLMLSIPSNFIVKCNCTQFAHIVQQRDNQSHAAPELKECVESMMAQINAQIPQLDRAYFHSVRN